MSTIQLRTPIPGPRSEALMKRRDAAVVPAAYHATPVFVAKAEGAVIEDVDGNRLIDFAGGIGCLNTGHRAPAVVEAVRRQLDRFLHTSFNVLPYESYIAVCERLNALAPGKGPKKTILVSTGAEAVENAIKIARYYTKRPAILCFEDAFHGRTYMAMAATSKTHPYKAGFEPFPGDVYRIPYAYCFRCSYSMTYPSCDVHCARHIEDTFNRVVAAESVAAVIVEPILGEGGFVTPPAEFNIYVDPEAAQAVFQAGIPLTMVGLDVTRKAVLREEHIQALEAAHNPVSQAAGRITRAIRNRSRGGNGQAMHDSLALATFLDPSLVTLQEMHVEVETRGEFTAGETLGYRRAPIRRSPPLAEGPAKVEETVFHPNAKVALDVDAERFLKLLVGRLTG